MDVTIVKGKKIASKQNKQDWKAFSLKRPRARLKDSKGKSRGPPKGSPKDSPKGSL